MTTSAAADDDPSPARVTIGLSLFIDILSPPTLMTSPTGLYGSSVLRAGDSYQSRPTRLHSGEEHNLAIFEPTFLRCAQVQQDACGASDAGLAEDRTAHATDPGQL